MTRSRHRYTLQERAPMDTHPLEDLVTRFGRYQVSRGFAKGTRERYRYTFLLFGRFLDETGRPHTSAVLTTQGMEDFATWLRETPAKPQHGKSRRAESGIHAHLRDMRAF